MRSSARPVLLRSLNVIGGATAPSPAPVAAAPFGLRADDEILIKSVLPSGIGYRSLSLIHTNKCMLLCVSQWYSITQTVSSRKVIPPFQPSACGRSLILHPESPHRRLFLVEIVFKVYLPEPGAFEHIQLFR